MKSKPEKSVSGIGGARAASISDQSWGLETFNKSVANENDCHDGPVESKISHGIKTPEKSSLRRVLEDLLKSQTPTKRAPKSKG